MRCWFHPSDLLSKFLVNFITSPNSLLIRNRGAVYLLEFNDHSPAGVPLGVRRDPLKVHSMETSLETVALFSLKLAYEEEGLSPILRDDMVMGDYQKDIFELLVRRGDVQTIQFKMNECLGLAMDALGGVEKPLGRELHKLSADLSLAQSLEQLDQPLLALKGYLKDIL